MKIQNVTSRRAGNAVICTVFWLQGITIFWMLIECAASLFAARKAHSVALLAFGSDSFIELLSAVVVVFSFSPQLFLSKARAARMAGVLLYILAVVISGTAIATLIYGSHPETSGLGIGVTITALVIMPLLAWIKRKTANAANSCVLAADAVQSATCAYLAAMTLLGLVMTAIFHLGWIDSVAALGAVPILMIEGRRAMKGDVCSCC